MLNSINAFVEPPLNSERGRIKSQQIASRVGKTAFVYVLPTRGGGEGGGGGGVILPHGTSGIFICVCVCVIMYLFY